MKRFLKRQSESALETQLRRDRPQPPAELMQRLTDRVVDDSRRHRRPRARIAAAGIALIAVLAAFSAFGGIGYAANAIKTVVVTAKTVIVAPLEAKKPDSNNTQSQNNQQGNNNKGGNNNDNKGGDDGGKPDDKEYGHKKKVCHNPGPHQQTLEVSDNAVPALLGHGDYLGECHR